MQWIIPINFLCAIVILTGTALASDPETIPVPRERPTVLEDRSSAPKIELYVCLVSCGSPKLPNSDLTHAHYRSRRMHSNRRRQRYCSAPTRQASGGLLSGRNAAVFDGRGSLALDPRRRSADARFAGMSLRGIETFDPFGCRSFNGISGAKLSEHGHANALDVRSLKLANGTVIELTNATVSKALREQLRQTACARFSTVLGNGADAYHENHVHIDLMQRSNNYRICQWNILDRTEIAALAAKKAAAVAMPIPAAIVQSSEVPVPRPRPPINTDAAALPRETMLRGPGERMMRTPGSLFLVVPVATSAAAYAEERQEQAITIGPWTIGTSYKADKFDSCSMSRSTEGMDITFLRTPDGLLLFLQSPNWKLEGGKAYTIRLMAGSRSVEVKALAELKAVTIALADRAFRRKVANR